MSIRIHRLSAKESTLASIRIGREFHALFSAHTDELLSWDGFETRRKRIIEPIQKQTVHIARNSRSIFELIDSLNARILSGMEPLLSKIFSPHVTPYCSDKEDKRLFANTVSTNIALRMTTPQQLAEELEIQINNELNNRPKRSSTFYQEALALNIAQKFRPSKLPELLGRLVEIYKVEREKTEREKTEREKAESQFNAPSKSYYK